MAAPSPANRALSGIVTGLPPTCATTAVARQPSATPRIPLMTASAAASSRNWVAT